MEKCNYNLVICKKYHNLEVINNMNNCYNFVKTEGKQLTTENRKLMTEQQKTSKPFITGCYIMCYGRVGISGSPCSIRRVVFYLGRTYSTKRERVFGYDI